MTTIPTASTTVRPEPRPSAAGGVTHPAVRTIDVVKTYGAGDSAVHALRSVSVDFAAGEFTAVMGPSGSGKSTLMHVAAGLDTVTGGQVLIGDTDVDRAQRQGADPPAPGPDRVRLPAVQPGPDAERRREHRAADAARRPPPGPGLAGPHRRRGRPADRLSHRPAELSGGQQQRVAVARALAGRPEVVFADEPTGNLDSRSGAEVLSFLRRSVDETQQTIVMVTHDPVAAVTPTASSSSPTARSSAR